MDDVSKLPISASRRSQELVDEKAQQHQAQPDDAPTKEISTDPEGFSENAQTGVQKVEAVAMVWTKFHLFGSYAL